MRAEIDPRVALAVALVLGTLVWRAGPIGLALYSAALLTAVVIGSQERPSERRTFVAYARFTVLWVVVKWAFDMLRGVDALGAATAAGLLGWRMFLLLVLGLVLALACSARGLGAALAWALRPVLRQRAWEVGLALALMVHFLPGAWRTLAGLRDTLTRRAASLIWWRRQAVLAQATANEEDDGGSDGSGGDAGTGKGHGAHDLESGKERWMEARNNCVARSPSSSAGPLFSPR